MTGRDVRERVTALWTGRPGGGRALAAPLTALLLSLCVLLCLFAAAALAGAASATPAAVPPAAQGPQLLTSTVDLGRPTVKAPTGTTTSLRPTFRWSRVKGARSYDLRIYRGGVLQRFFNGQHGTSRHVRKALPANVTLTFKVRARNARGAGAWSKGARFVISAPRPESPVGAIASASPTFRWRALRGAARYDVSVSGGGVRLMQSDVVTLSCEFDRELPANVPLTWKVRGRNTDGKGAWSRSLRFTIAPRSSAKAITAFSFQGLTPAVTGAIDETAHTIALTVPYGTNVTALVASFTTTGASVKVGAATQVSGVTPNDFTSPATYTVTAADGTTQAYTVTVTVTPLAVGAAYQGGVVAYILQEGDPGYVAGQTKGLIAAAADQTAGTGIQWALPANQGTRVSGAQYTGLGTGAANTAAIIDQNGDGATYAAGLARAYAGGGYHDWYLPSSDEMYRLYESRAVIGGFHTGSGDMPYYWSSSQSGSDDSEARCRNFDTGGVPNMTKDELFRVRAVRSFSNDPSKAITAFSFATPAATGVITESAHTIAVSVPYGTSVTALVASFTTTGDSVTVGGTTQTSDVTANDFTSPVTYRVTAGNGSTQDYEVTVTVTPLAIGDAYQGGVVAYILQDGDPGYVAGQTKGLIAAAADQSTGIVWALPAHQDHAVPGGTGTDLGTGLANTDKIISQNGPGSTYAAGLARAYAGGGFTDWYLPSQDELDKVYTNRTAIGDFDATGHYWSSSEYSADYAWVQYFGGGHYIPVKYAPYRMRAVRSFSGVSSKAITAFSFQGLTPAVTGAIDETAHTIALTVPYGTNVTALVATFTTTGASVKVGATTQVSGTTANDFTGSVTYTVTAADGTTQAYEVTVTVAPLAIGDAYQGGVVAYILQAGDPGYVAGETKGLIAAAADQSTGIVWSNITTWVGTGDTLGTGQANTTAIVNQPGCTGGAAKLCDDLTLGGYGDWYLPSKDELHKLYLNKAAIGGFYDEWYWTSSTSDAIGSWTEYFSDGQQGYWVKAGELRVRAVRSF